MVQDPSKFFPRVQIGTLKINIFSLFLSFLFKCIDYLLVYDFVLDALIDTYNTKKTEIAFKMERTIKKT